jgi:hypothetical protein
MRLYPDKPPVLYLRMSGPGSPSLLARKQQAMRRAYHQQTGKVAGPPIVVATNQCSKLSVPQPYLEKAVALTLRHNGILVAETLKKTLGVPLATLLEPWRSEREQQAYLTLRTRTVGRPLSGIYNCIPEVFAALGYLTCTEKRLTGEPGTSLVDKWQNPIADIAKHFGVAASTLHDLIHKHQHDLSPDGVRSYRQVAEAEAIEQGRLDDNGMPYMPPLTARESRSLFYDEYTRQNGIDPDNRCRQNRTPGKRMDGGPDRRYKRNRGRGR